MERARDAIQRLEEETRAREPGIDTDAAWARANAHVGDFRDAESWRARYDLLMDRYRKRAPEEWITPKAHRAARADDEPAI